MKLKILTLADYATIDVATRKLTIVGAFTVIFAKQFPVKHRRMVIVAKIAAELGDTADQHEVKVTLEDDDNVEVAQLITPFSIPHVKTGVRPDFDLLWEINQLEFPHDGHYRITVAIDGKDVGDTSIQLMQIN